MPQETSIHTTRKRQSLHCSASPAGPHSILVPSTHVECVYVGKHYLYNVNNAMNTCTATRNTLRLPCNTRLEQR